MPSYSTSRTEALRWGGACLGVGGGEQWWEEEGSDLVPLLCPPQDSSSGEEQALCVRNRSAFEQQHHHLLHCLEKTTVRPKGGVGGVTERGAFLCSPTSTLPGMGGSLLIVEIPQGFLEEAPVQLSLEGWAEEGKQEILPVRRERPQPRPRAGVSSCVLPHDRASLPPTVP